MKANYKDLYLITDNLAALYEDGIPIVLSLELVSKLPLNKEYKKSLIDIKSKVVEGKTLASSFNEKQDLYPELFLGVVDIGEGSGRLVSVLKSLKEFYFHMDDVRKKVISSIRYPLIVLSTLLFFILVLIVFLIPNVYELCNLNKNTSPVISCCYEFSQYLKNNTIYSLILLAAGILVLVLSYKYLKISNKERTYGFLFKINILKQYYEYVFIMILSIIMSSGINISKGLDLCLESIEIRNIKQVMENLKSDILTGSQMTEALTKVEFLSDYSLAMISLGEESGNLEVVLRKISQRLEKNFLERLEKIVSYIMPLSIIFVGFLILIFVVIFINPMFDALYLGVE